MTPGMRDLLRIVESMTRGEAEAVFKQHGYDASTMTPKQLRDARNQMARASHPDTGGSDDRMKQVNNAYDLLKDLAGDAVPRARSTSEPAFTVAAFGDDPPNEVEAASVSSFPVERPTLDVRWYNWVQRFTIEEVADMLKLPDGGEVEADDADRTGGDNHRYHAVREGDLILLRFTHVSIRRNDAGEEVRSAEFGHVEYALPIAILSRGFEELKRAPERGRAVRAHNKAHPDGPWLSGNEDIFARRFSVR